MEGIIMTYMVEKNRSGSRPTDQYTEGTTLVHALHLYLVEKFGAMWTLGLHWVRSVSDEISSV